MSSSLNAIRARRKKKEKKGIQLCLMVCGASGTGRTTFVNTLCGRKVLADRNVDDASNAHIEEPLGIKPITVDLESEVDDTRISLTIVDTPGFGNQIDSEASFGQIIDYLQRQYDEVLAVDCRIKRKPRFQDDRVHALLYFITPTGHGLRELDIELMKRLSPRVNVIPVIGRADSLTPSELTLSKQLIREDIQHYNIPIYNFPYDEEEDDEETIQENMELRGLLPFAIVGSEEVVEILGRKVRARQYPWGNVEVENPKHSDFLAIKNVLLNTHLADLKQITYDFHYENYRTEKLSKTVEGDGDEGNYSMNADDLSSQSILLKEQSLRRAEQKLKELEIKLAKEIEDKQQELLIRESQLKELETSMHMERNERSEQIEVA